MHTASAMNVASHVPSGASEVGGASTQPDGDPRRHRWV